ncbi:hypothetical protein HYFRA_00002269 [Hymenoscyphus fraxineus]|uniref:Uncharacterized protein n=1 Tax=Hymenoscyphus fraxineus TaxID=746836 RepID=A0A9N9LA41_9HELO|nr:hypothetical protein HYFRA_00002269 [Hymenoscyphus fraxineus]
MSGKEDDMCSQQAKEEMDKTRWIQEPRDTNLRSYDYDHDHDYTRERQNDIHTSNHLILGDKDK